MNFQDKMDYRKILKNNKYADHFRSLGNDEFSKDNLFGALLLFNQSLSISEPGSVTMSLAYGNRSAVYFRTTNYENCLNNIELARQNNYPEEKIHKLDERASLCCDLLKKNKSKKSEDNRWTFFKLSYPSNPKIPFIIDCLELTKGKKNINSVKTNKNLKFGDIVSIESPFYSIVNESSMYLKCANCFTSNLMDLIPCKRCKTSEYSCLNQISNIQNLLLNF